MRSLWIIALSLVSVPLAFSGAHSSQNWHEIKQGLSDLALSGELAGLPPDSTRYLTRDDLLSLPQTNLIVADDANFSGPVKIRGLKLEEMVKRFAASPESMVVAICDDGYRAPYPHAYLEAHHPVLVLQVNGEPPPNWPKAAEDHASDMGPYMISNPKFTPNFKVLSHSDEPQIPWGVVRLELRNENAVVGAITPRGPNASDPGVQDGFRIAQQNCFRCHTASSEGAEKSGVSWEKLGGLAASWPVDFAAYVRAPKGKNPKAQMPGNPQYDEATLGALTAYFKTFAVPAKP